MACDLQSLNFELAGLKPPIPRDRLIFEEVMVKGRSQLEVAGEHGISQPRVSIIVGEVTAWLCRVLPEAAAKEGAAGQAALGFWLARARLEFLYNKALAAFDASGQDKVTYKERRRTEVACEEKITRQQSPSVGLFNGALRAAVASARMCCAEAKSSGGSAGRQAAEMSPPSPVMSNSAKTEEFSPTQSPQTQPAAAFTTGAVGSVPRSEAAIKRVMEIARQDPKRADWTEAELRWAAEIALAKTDVDVEKTEAWLRQRAATKAAKAAAREAKVSAPRAKESVAPPIPVAASSGIDAPTNPIPRKHEAESLSLSAARVEKLRREREKRRGPEERRRTFLAPLAVG